ncbi:MAG TPA: histidine phosphatase family protein [Acidimicrobiia bacterium]|nr:histidine phosphatase family protein [Acidimicrobiia bacterium]
MTRLVLVRHGESTWNAAGRWQGHADPPLSPLGERQAADAAEHAQGVEAVWTSDLARARRSAEIIAGLRGLGVRVEPGLRERDAGEWQGLTRTEIEQLWPGYLGSGRRPPGFEGDEALLARALAAITEIGAAHRGESVLVVTHGGVVRTLERHLGAEDRGLLPNLGGRVLELGRPGRNGVWTLGPRVLLLEGVTVTRPEQI